MMLEVDELDAHGADAVVGMQFIRELFGSRSPPKGKRHLVTAEAAGSNLVVPGRRMRFSAFTGKLFSLLVWNQIMICLFSAGQERV